MDGWQDYRANRRCHSSSCSLLCSLQIIVMFSPLAVRLRRARGVSPKESLQKWAKCDNESNPYRVLIVEIRCLVCCRSFKMPSRFLSRIHSYTGTPYIFLNNRRKVVVVYPPRWANSSTFLLYRSSAWRNSGNFLYMYWLDRRKWRLAGLGSSKSGYKLSPGI